MPEGTPVSDPAADAAIRRQSVKKASRAIDTYFEKSSAGALKVDAPTEFQVLRFTMLERGSVALIRLPYPSGTPQFEIHCRSIRNLAQDFQITCLFFGQEQDFEAIQLDQDTCARLGLQKIDQKTAH